MAWLTETQACPDKSSKENTMGNSNNGWAPKLTKRQLASNAQVCGCGCVEVAAAES